MLDREKIQEDFKIEKLNKKGKMVKRKRSKKDGTLNCLEMGMAFLRNEEDIKNFTPEMLTDFIKAIVDIWKPEGDKKAEQKGSWGKGSGNILLLRRWTGLVNEHDQPSRPLTADMHMQRACAEAGVIRL